MPKTKNNAGDKPLPANQQKGKKRCGFCKKEKKVTDYYISKSPLFAVDERVPICKECMINESLNEDGSVNELKLNKILKQVDKPYYKDMLESALNSFLNENSYIEKDKAIYYGKEILQKYFMLIARRQDRARSYEDSEKDGFIHQNSNVAKSTKEQIAKKYADINDTKKCLSTSYNSKVFLQDDDFELTDDIINLFGEGYDKSEYKKMYDKYINLRQNYRLETSLHQEALATYVRFKVKEEMATASGNVDEANKWYNAAQNAASNGKLTPKQLSAADLQKGINSFSELTLAIEQATDVISILPKYMTQPHDAPDFNIYCYISYARKLKGLPPIEYKDIYRFYDDKMKEYLKQYGDPNGIFTESNETMLKNRPNIEKFIALPNDYNDLSDENEDDVDE